jgi:hypothetical protein
VQSVDPECPSPADVRQILAHGLRHCRGPGTTVPYPEEMPLQASGAIRSGSLMREVVDEGRERSLVAAKLRTRKSKGPDAATSSPWKLGRPKKARPRSRSLLQERLPTACLPRAGKANGMMIRTAAATRQLGYVGGDPARDRGKAKASRRGRMPRWHYF